MSGWREIRCDVSRVSRDRHRIAEPDQLPAGAGFIGECSSGQQCSRICPDGDLGSGITAHSRDGDGTGWSEGVSDGPRSVVEAIRWDRTVENGLRDSGGQGRRPDEIGHRVVRRILRSDRGGKWQTHGLRCADGVPYKVVEGTPGRYGQTEGLR